VITLIEQIRAIATEGLAFANDQYDRDRYSQLLKLVASPVAQGLKLPDEDVLKVFYKHWGCITPKIGIEVAITNDNCEALVLRRTDDDKWGVACGWMDIGESPFCTAQREAFEETGIRVQPRGYIAIRTKGPKQGLPHQLNVLVCTAPVAVGTQVSLSHEHNDAAWVRHLPDWEWHPGHEKTVKLLLEYAADPSAFPMIRAESWL
jgi:8-oxo-dGTP pyrophosphatase MutT (NUDIX family)